MVVSDGNLRTKGNKRTKGVRTKAAKGVTTKEVNAIVFISPKSLFLE